MKKYVIAVVATIATLFLLAQTGLLAPFGIKQLSFTRENGDKDAPQQQNEEFTDTVNDLSYKFKTEGKSFYVYKNGGWQEELMTGVNIGASEPALFPGDLTISYDTYLRWFEYISEMNCNCVRVYTTMRPQFYLALRDFNEKAEKPVYLYQGIWVNEDDIERLGDVYAENEKILSGFKTDAISLVDVIHGNALIPESAGKASGTYRTDVSRWLAGWIIGIEWDPNLVLNTNEQHPRYERLRRQISLHPVRDPIRGVSLPCGRRDDRARNRRIQVPGSARVHKLDHHRPAQSPKRAALRRGQGDRQHRERKVPQFRRGYVRVIPHLSLLSRQPELSGGLPEKDRRKRQGGYLHRVFRGSSSTSWIRRQNSR